MGKQERKPRIAVTERGSQTTREAIINSDPRYKKRLDSPFNEPSAPIALKDDTRECRWFNAAIASDHVWRAKNKGWDQVRPDDVVDLEQIGGYNKSADGYITRGERGQEVLMSMPKAVRDMIQMAKTRDNLARMGSPAKTKADIVNAASQKLGDEAASYLNDRIVGPVGGVTDSYERVERTLESED
jgi:hypothetical protein